MSSNSPGSLCAKLCSLLRKNQSLSLWLGVSILLSGCASSDVSRDVSSGVDMGVHNANNLYKGATEGDLADAYQNTSQSTKGALLGGTAGALTGVMSSSVGFIPGTAVGALLGASYGAYLDAHGTLQDRLDNRGINTIVLGDHILIVIPSARIFDSLSPTINPSAYSTLKVVADYVNSFTKTLVKVAVYTNDLGSARVNLSLSQQQAKALGTYLLASGLDARLLYAQGYGGTHLVEKNSVSWDGSDNYRIEITLEKLEA